MPTSQLENASPTLEIAIKMARGGDSAAARQIFKQFVAREPNNALAWVWLAFVSSATEEKRVALRKALILNPEDHRISEALQGLMSQPYIARAARTGVFISYARQDELFAVNLTESLRSAGIRAWLDVTDVPDDVDWQSAVVTALNTCGVMLTIFSPDALQSSDLRNERHQFATSGKIVVPVLYQPCDFNRPDMWYPPVDFRQDYALGLQQLLKLLV